MRETNLRRDNTCEAPPRACKVSSMPNHVEASPYAAARPRGILNLVWGAIATLLSGLWTAICAIGAATGATLGTHHAVTVITRAWGRGIIKVCGIRVDIEGLENLDGLNSFV